MVSSEQFGLITPCDPERCPTVRGLGGGETLREAGAELGRIIFFGLAPIEVTMGIAAGAMQIPCRKHEIRCPRLQQVIDGLNRLA